MVKNRPWLEPEPYGSPIPQSSLKRLARHVLTAPWKICFPPSAIEMAKSEKERRESVSSDDSAAFSDQSDGWERKGITPRQRERELIAQRNEARVDVETMEIDMQGITTRLEASEQQCSSLQAEKQHLQVQIALASQQDKNNQQRIADLERQVHYQQKFLQQNEATIAKFQREVQDLRELRGVEDMSTNQRLSECESSLKTVTAQWDTSKAELAKAKAQLATVRDQLKRAQLGNDKSEAGRLRAELDKTKADLQGLTDKVDARRGGRRNSLLPQDIEEVSCYPTFPQYLYLGLTIVKAFLDLQENITEFVNRRINAMEDDENRRKAAIQYSAAHPEEVAWLINEAGKNINITTAILLSNTDVEALGSMIWDQLMQWIFFPDTNFMYTGAQVSQIEAIRILEERMKNGTSSTANLARGATKAPSLT